MKRTATLVTLGLISLVFACRPAPPEEPPPPVRQLSELPGQLDDDYSPLLGEGETPQDGGTIIRHLESDVTTLNPILRTHSYEGYVARYLFDTLYGMNSALEFVPVLAKELPKVSKSGRVQTIELRDDVRFHDGEPLTAADVKFTFDMVMNEQVPAVNLRAALELLEEVEVVDEHTLRLTWKSKYAAALSAISGIEILPEHVYKTDRLDMFTMQRGNRKPIGSGPWKFVDWEAGQSVTVERNDDYWGPKPKPDKTIFKVIENRVVALKACQTGELDEQYVPPKQWVTEAATPEFIAEFNRAAWYRDSFNYVSFNTRSPLFDDARVRRAMTMLQDREAMVRDLYDGYARVASGPFNAETEWYNEAVEPLPYDPEAAKALLVEAGWTDTDADGTIDKDGKPFRFVLAYPSGSTVAEQTGALWQESLALVGVALEMRAFEGATFFDKLSKGEFESATLAWVLDPDPDWVYALFHSSQAPPVGVNHGFYSNPELDPLLEAQRTELDVEKRRQIIHQIHQILRDDAPYMFSIQVPEKRVFRSTIRGVNICPVGPFLSHPGGAQWWLASGPRPAM